MLLGKYCGTTFPNNIRSLSSTLYLHFVSDFSNGAAGFEIEWESTATGCGGVLSSYEGTITSPNYPLTYHHNAYCTYKITTNQGSNILITMDDLDFEGRHFCFDSVDVRDMKTDHSLTNGPVCSRTTPFNVTTSDNAALVIFKSDFSDAGRGFSLTYKTLCNRKLSGYRGVIESPNFPNSYPHNIDCSWTIDIPMGNTLGMEFSHFKLEELFSDRCMFDYLEILEMDGETQIDNRYCSSKPDKQIGPNTKSVKITFHSDISLSESGFRLEWAIQGCGDVLDRPFGRIQENNYNRTIPTECNWKIVTSIGKHIELNITEFIFNGAGDCSQGGLVVST